jgi:hypothetical protein
MQMQPRLRPVAALAGVPVVQVAAAGQHCLCVTTVADGGAVWSWGRGRRDANSGEARGATRPPSPRDCIGFPPTFRWVCMGSNGSHLPLAPLAERELLPQARGPRPARALGRDRLQAAAPAAVAVGESVITCWSSSERAQSQLRSYVSLSTFSGDGHLMTDSPAARLRPRELSPPAAGAASPTALAIGVAIGLYPIATS